MHSIPLFYSTVTLELTIAWIPEPVDAVRHFDRYGGNLVISCVDNHEARKEIHRVNGCGVYAGNHAQAGQVSIGNADDPDLVRRFIHGRDGKYPYLPKEGLLFPELHEPEPPRPTPEPTASCADLLAEGSQHLLINDMMAMTIGQYVYRLLHRQPIFSFLTYVSIGEMPAIRSLPICREELEVYL